MKFRRFLPTALLGAALLLSACQGTPADGSDTAGTAAAWRSVWM